VPLVFIFLFVFWFVKFLHRLLGCHFTLPMFPFLSQRMLLMSNVARFQAPLIGPTLTICIPAPTTHNNLETASVLHSTLNIACASATSHTLDPCTRITFPSS
jgi:hypothetical protein